MRLLYKQLIRQTGRNRVFIVLLFSLIFLSSLSFFFVKFSIDGNKAILDVLPVLSENQIQYKKALTSNNSLAYRFLFSMMGLTAFVFVLFFYRFFRSSMQMIGCLKAMGFKDRQLCNYFVVFTALLSLAGSITGLFAGYALSGILIEANIRTYSVTGLVKGIDLFSIAAGLGGSLTVSSFTAFLCCWFVRGKEPGLLIAGEKKAQTVKASLRIANYIANMIPVKNKASLRIALRKPMAVFLIFTAVMTFNVCMILGYSLNLSSQIVFDSQTTGHNYEYDSRFSGYIAEDIRDNGLHYLYYEAKLITAGYPIEQTLIGLYGLNELYELQSKNGLLPAPEPDNIYINPGLFKTYGVREGDSLTVTISGKDYDYIVAGIADNAKSASIFVNALQLTERLDIPSGSYNGVWSMESKDHDAAVGDTSYSESTGGTAGSQLLDDKAHKGDLEGKPHVQSSRNKTQRIALLEKNAVSNNTSGVINQVIGGVIGCILLFLAVYVNFQDNREDIQILDLMGYPPKEICSLLVDVYKPILWGAFLLAIVPSIFIAESIQRSLSAATSDYMPFSTNLPVVLLLFILMNLIYMMGQIIFLAGTRNMLTNAYKK